MTDTTVAYHVEDGVGRPAINVKVYAPNHLFWPAGLTSDEQAHEDIIAAAHERVTSDFWQAATEIAEQKGLGEITQEGRSGGWLVFTSTDPQRPETLCPDHAPSADNPDGEPCDWADTEGVKEWLAGYRSMVAWADAWIADAPRKVAALAQQYAMDEAGEGAALRFFAFDAGFPHRYMASVARGNAIMAGYEEGAPA